MALGLGRAPASLLSLIHARAVPQQAAATPATARSSAPPAAPSPGGGAVDVGKVLDDLKRDLAPAPAAAPDVAPKAKLPAKSQAAPPVSPEALSAVADARSELAAAKAAADAKLSGNADYQSAKSALDEADRELNALRKTEPIGSSALADASQRRNDAWSNLKSITGAAEAKDPLVIKARQDLAAAEARLRTSAPGN